MAQIFHPSMNTVSKLSIFGFGFFVAAALFLLAVVVRSPYLTQAETVRQQPVPFSHKHHVTRLGLDCRYCHTTVEDSRFAGLPPTKTCMTCHSQIWTDSPMLEPLRASYRDDTPIRWTRVNDLPDFAYFDHSIHIHKGIGCATCHGEVNQMPLTWRARTLQMRWCLDCHRAPERYVRPRERVFDMGWDQPAPELVRTYHIESMTDCSTCHR